MPTHAALAPCLTAPSHDSEQELLAFSQQTLRAILVARALADSDRSVDLKGLQGQVGLLCAKALDLPLGQTGFVKLELRRLVHGLDALSDSLRNNHP